MTRITFSDNSHPVTVYNDLVGPALGLFGKAVERENTEGGHEWVDAKEMAHAIHDILPEDVKGKIDDNAIRDRIKTTTPDGLTHITDLAGIITRQLRQKRF